VKVEVGFEGKKIVERRHW